LAAATRIIAEKASKNDTDTIHMMMMMMMMSGFFYVALVPTGTEKKVRGKDLLEMHILKREASARATGAELCKLHDDVVVDGNRRNE
jgi:hypothetical protein